MAKQRIRLECAGSGVEMGTVDALTKQHFQQYRVFLNHGGQEIRSPSELPTDFDAEHVPVVLFKKPEFQFKCEGIASTPRFYSDIFWRRSKDATQNSQWLLWGKRLPQNNAVALHPNGQMFASPDFNQHVKICDSTSRECIRVIGKSRLPYIVLNVIWSPDGRTIAVALRDVTYEKDALKIWTVDGKKIQTWKNIGFRWGNNAFGAWHPDSQTLAMPTESHIELFNVNGKRQKFTQIDEMPLKIRLAWNPNGETLASADKYGISIWDMRGVQVTKIEIGLRNTNTWGLNNFFDLKIAWHPDGTKIAVLLCECGVLELWNTDGEFLNRIEHVRCFVWRPDGQMMATADQYDNKILFWT